MGEQFWMAAGGGQAGDVEAFLHGHRYPEERRGTIAPGVQRSRAVAGAIEVAHHHSVDARIQPFDPRDVMVEQFQRRDFTRAQLRGEACGRLERQVHILHSHPGGGTKPCHAVSNSFATSMVVRSAYCAPTICTPIGNPSGEKPSGAAVAGSR